MRCSLDCHRQVQFNSSPKKSRFYFYFFTADFIKHSSLFSKTYLNPDVVYHYYHQQAAANYSPPAAVQMLVLLPGPPPLPLSESAAPEGIKPSPSPAFSTTSSL
jgi:hypothetical protein